MHISTLSSSIEIPNVDPRPPNSDEMMGLALETLRLTPLNGLRYPPAGGASGWYVWGGEDFSQSADFFSPIQVRDLSDYVPNIQSFLSLPPGFRFLIDEHGHPKAWLDGSLLDV